MEYFFKHLGFTLDTAKRMKSFYLLVILIQRKQSLACLNFKVILILRTFEKDKICFKNPENPRRIDLFITNSSGSFQNTTTGKRLIGCSENDSNTM